ncbi:LEA type 2 family protein [Pendulispora rubella]|uniref:LEA type 2 family protein n=1 Tax=Pendulispora rubella TaxID=2741070 RepID=A0ABZ2KZ32_9BACT
MRPFAAVVVAAVALQSLACSKPQPPEITVKDAKVTEVNAGGLTVAVNAELYNPNKFPMTLQSVTGNVKLEGKYDLGQVTVSTPVSLPAGARTPATVPLVMKWQNAGSMAALVTGGETIPFTVAGTAAVGGEKLSVDVPFQVQGSVTRAQIGQAVMRSFPGFPPVVPSK